MKTNFDELLWEVSERKQDKANGVFGSEEVWRKYSNYQIAYDRDGLPLIIPALGSTCTIYNPFDFYPEILVSFMNLVKDIDLIFSDKRLGNYNSNGINISDNEEKLLLYAAKKILRFNQDFGLLGLYDDGMSSVFIGDGGKFKVRLRSNAQVAIPSRLKIHKVTSDIDYNLYASFFSPVDKKIPQYYDDNKYSNLGDPVYDLYHSFLSYSGLFKVIEIGNNQLKQISPMGVTWGETISDLATTSEIALSFKYTSNGPQMIWKFKSLLDALHIMLIYNLTIDNNHIRFCELDTCNRPFIANTKTQKYCSTNCNNTARQRRFNLKKKISKED